MPGFRGETGRAGNGERPSKRRAVEPAPSWQLRGKLLTDDARPLPGSLRTALEDQTDHDLRHVRVHRGPAADLAVRTVGARAFTVGHHVVMGSEWGLGSAGSPSQLLSHELGHVLQQRAGSQVSGSAPERSADRIGRALRHGASIDAAPVAPQAVDIAAQAEPGARLPALSADELMKVVSDQRGFVEGSARQPKIDPKGVGTPTGKGYTTHAAVQILDAQGRQVHVGTGAYLGGGKTKPHGEAGAVHTLRASLRGVDVRGGSMMVAVEQVPCGGCDSQLRTLARDLGLKQMDVYVPERPKVRGQGMVTPKTAARTVHQGKRPPTTTRLHSSVSLGGAPPAPPAAAPAPRATPARPATRPPAAPAPSPAGGAQRFKLTGNVLRSLRGAAFSAGLAVIGGAIRKTLQDKAFERQFNAMLADPKAAAAIESAYRAAKAAPTPSRPRYLHVHVGLQFLGSYEPGFIDSFKFWKQPHEHESLQTQLEAIFGISFQRVSVTFDEKPACGPSTWTPIRGSAAMYRWQDCTFPFSIDPDVEQRIAAQQAAEARRKAFDDCVRLELERPGGVPSGAERQAAQQKCAQQTGFSLAELAE